MNIPALGVGMIYSPGLEHVLEAAADLLDVIEVEPQAFWFREDHGGYRPDGRLLGRLERFPGARLVHGVGFPVGGSAPADSAALRPFVAAIEALASPWASEHLSFNRLPGPAESTNTGFLLPPLQTPASVALAATNITQVQRHLGVPFAFETGVNYLQPRADELSDGAFFAQVAEQADCGILLDLHNLYANERNGRQPVRELLAELPLERVWEIHLAGGEELDGYWLDAHSGVIPPPVLELAGELVPALPHLGAIIFELMPDYLLARNLTPADVVEQVRAMHRLWDMRTASGPLLPPASPTTTQTPWAATDMTPADWEATLTGLVHGAEPTSPLGRQLATDPGMRILRELVATGRAGVVADLLPLTCRLIILYHGEGGLRDLLWSYWAGTSPQPFGADEADGFATYLASRPTVPHADEVAAFEVASHRAYIDGRTRIVRFTCEPMPLLKALGRGDLPQPTTSGRYDVEVRP